MAHAINGTEERLDVVIDQLGRIADGVAALVAAMTKPADLVDLAEPAAGKRKKAS